MRRIILVVLVFLVNLKVSPVHAQAAEYLGYDRDCQANEKVALADGTSVLTHLTDVYSAIDIYHKVCLAVRRTNLSCAGTDREKVQASIVYDVVANWKCVYGSVGLGAKKLFACDQALRNQLTALAEREYVRYGWLTPADIDANTRAKRQEQLRQDAIKEQVRRERELERERIEILERTEREGKARAEAELVSLKKAQVLEWERVESLRIEEKLKTDTKRWLAQVDASWPGHKKNFLFSGVYNRQKSVWNQSINRRNQLLDKCVSDGYPRKQCVIIIAALLESCAAFIREKYKTCNKLQSTILSL